MTFDVVVPDVAYAEGLRWHDGVLWYSDMLRDAVCTVDERGRVEQVFEVDEPSGLGFLPDGRVAVVARGPGAILAGLPGRALDTLCALEAQGVVGVNDLATDDDGRMYVGSLGARYRSGDEHRDWSNGATGKVLLVEPGGSWRVAATDLACPNGMAVTPDGATLVVAETYRHRLTAFHRAPDGSLDSPRTLASAPAGSFDGLTLDVDGAVWVGTGGDFRRYSPAGELLERHGVDGALCIACALGGTDGRTLFMAVAEMTMEGFAEGRSRGRILATRVDVPGAGRP